MRSIRTFSFNSFQLGFRLIYWYMRYAFRRQFQFLLVRLQTRNNYAISAVQLQFQFLLVRLQTHPTIPIHRIINKFQFLLVRLQTKTCSIRYVQPKTVSIPFSQALDYCRLVCLSLYILCFNSFQLGFRRENTQYVLPPYNVFQFLLVRLQTILPPGSQKRSSCVSIPFSQALDRNSKEWGQNSRSVSIPFSQALDWNKKLEPMPLRQFQFLLVRLQTHRDKCRCF